VEDGRLPPRNSADRSGTTRRKSHGSRSEFQQIPPENALKGNGEGTERERELISVPNGTGGFTAKPAGEVTKAELWSVGKSLLFEQGMPKPQCGTFVGKLCSDYGDDIVIDAVRATCVKRPPTPPISQGVLHARRRPAQQDAAPRQQPTPDSNTRTTAKE
jgi:hypothetical protein